MTKAKGRTRIDRRLVDMTPSSPADDIRPDLSDVDPDDQWEESINHAIWLGTDVEGQIVVRERRMRETGQLTDFAVMLQVRPTGSSEGWTDVERVDCAHGEVHVDRYSTQASPTKDHEVVPANCRGNIELAYSWATEYIWSVEERMSGWL